MAQCHEIIESRCRDSHGASDLKLFAMAAVLVTSAGGVYLPVLIARYSRGLKFYGTLLVLVKCFAAGVILSTGFVHIMPEAFRALESDCLPDRPWHQFPFAGLVAMAGAILTLLVDILAAKHGESRPYVPLKSSEAAEDSAKCKDIEIGGHATVFPVDCDSVIGQHSGAAGAGSDLGIESSKSAMIPEENLEELEGEGQKLVSKVLEIGIIFHSIIIGITLGMSENRCTIRPLLGALSFHQFFEGIGLGGCLAQQAGLGTRVTAVMCLFSVTTPLGIATGMAMKSIMGFSHSRPEAVIIVEGLLGSASSGILVYMALVDLIAVEFLNTQKMKANPRLMAAAYSLLILGAGSMALLAVWA